MARQPPLEQIHGHFSSASGSSVWQVYANIGGVMLQGFIPAQPVLVQ